MSSNKHFSKKLKTYHNNRRNYHSQRKRQYLEVGQRGFLATCNFREKDCIRECYNVLNEYANDLYGPSALESKEPVIKDSGEEDISDALDKIIETTKKQSIDKNRRFQVVETGTNNCIFVKTTLLNPVELGAKIVEDISINKLQKTRHLFRLIPIEAVCKANINDIVDMAGPIFDKYFLSAEKTFSIVVNKRCNNDFNRKNLINVLAELVAEKGCLNKVDLTNSELSIIVEIIKGLCCISVVPHYNKWKKYNLVELANKLENKIIENDEFIEEKTIGKNLEAKDEENAKQ